MSTQLLSLYILASAGVGLVDALPRAQWGWFGHPHPSPGKFPTFPGYPQPSQSPSGVSVAPASASGSSLAFPSSFSVPSGSGISFPGGTGFPTGTGFGYGTGSVGGTGFSSFPVGTGFPSVSVGSSVPTGSASSVAAGSSVLPISSAAPVQSGPPVYGGGSAPQSSVQSSLAAPASASSVVGSSAPVVSASAVSGSSVPAASVPAVPISSAPASSAPAPSASGPLGPSASNDSASNLPVSSAPASSAPATSASSALAPSASNSSASNLPTSAASITASAGCTFTDADTAAASKGSCSSIVLSGITVPAGETLDLTDLNDGTTVTFEGTTTFEFEEWEGPLLSFSGNDITITGASGHVIDGNGAAWWDGEGSNGGVTKPKFFYAHDLTDSTISGLNIKNTPVQGMSINGATNLKVEDVTIDDTDGDTQGGHNTDCFDIGSSTGVHLTGIKCLNQDDCIAINSGTDISFTGGTCSGGHGLSIGSVGGRDDNTVEDIYIASSSISDSQNGVRIKCNSGTTGSVTNVTYSDITLSGITKYGIVIEQDYLNGGPTGDPTDGVPITDVTLEKITGTVTDDAQAYYILCAACSDWTVSGVDVTGGSESQDCEGVPSGASSLC